MTDRAITAGLVIFFAAWATSHLAIVAALAARSHPFKALIGLLPPLAPLGAYWAFEAGLRVRVAIWGACALGYVAFLALASL